MAITKKLILFAIELSSQHSEQAFDSGRVLAIQVALLYFRNNIAKITLVIIIKVVVQLTVIFTSTVCLKPFSVVLIKLDF